MEQDKPMKNDSEKNRLDLIPSEFIWEIGEVLTFGARKYAPNNWQGLEDGVDRHYAAAMRHLMQWRSGENRDVESGLRHLAHAACNLMFLMHHTEEK